MPGPAFAGRFWGINDLTAPLTGADRGQGAAVGRVRTRSEAEARSDP
jgi:hypothetical protein